MSDGDRPEGEARTQSDLRQRDETFKKYYVKYRTRIYWYVYRKISRDEESQDITADAFLKLYERMAELEERGDSGILAWLYTVARNQSIDYLRKQGNRQSRSIDDEEIDEATRVFDDFVEEAMKDADLEEVKAALDTIDETAREIMQLRYEEDLKFSEIADMMGKSEGACKMILYRGLEKLRDEILKSRKQSKK